MSSLGAVESVVGFGGRVGGFLPGEKVAVAIIEAHLYADAHGCLSRELLADIVDLSAEKVVLVGRSSGNLRIGVEP